MCAALSVGLSSACHAGYLNLLRENLTKARDAALAAVEIYNKPAIEFRAGNYIVLMVIA